MKRKYYKSLCKLSPGTLLRFHRLLHAVRNHDDVAALTAASVISNQERYKIRRVLQEVRSK